MGIRDIFTLWKDGGSLRFRLRMVKKELLFAWQRAWKGYDDSMWWSIDLHFMREMKVLLKHLREDGISHPANMTMEEWSDTLLEMETLLMQMDSLSDETFTADTELVKTRDKFFELFSLYFYDLWD